MDTFDSFHSTEHNPELLPIVTTIFLRPFLLGESDVFFFSSIIFAFAAIRSCVFPEQCCVCSRTTDAVDKVLALNVATGVTFI